MSQERKKTKPRPGKRHKPGEWIDWSEIPLGTTSDAEIGRQYGLKPHTVAGARRRLGIPSSSGNTNRFRPHKTDWDAEPLGEVPDSIIQERLGLKSVATVSSARQRRGIAKYDRLNVHDLRRFYFSLLDALKSFTDHDRETVERLFKKHKIG